MAFKKGQSGNSAGRPAGKTPATELKKIIADNMPDILQQMIKQAKNGDTGAAKALIDKVIPNLKPQAMTVQVQTSGSIAGQAQEVITATLEGSIPPDVSGMMLNTLANQAKLIEQEELIQRIEALEKKA